MSVDVILIIVVADRGLRVFRARHPHAKGSQRALGNVPQSNPARFGDVCVH